MVCHIDWLLYIEESLHPWNKSNLIMVYELFDVLLNNIPLSVIIFMVSLSIHLLEIMNILGKFSCEHKS